MIDFSAALREATDAGKQLGFLQCVKRMGEVIISRPDITPKQLYTLLCEEAIAGPSVEQKMETPL